MESFGQFQEIIRTARPQLAVVLGSGLGSATRWLKTVCSIDFSQIAGLGLPSVDGHEGRLRLAQWENQSVLLLEGRLHFYEGHSWEAVIRPMQLIHSFGTKFLLATNAAGGIHPSLSPGSLMIISYDLDWTRIEPGAALMDIATPRPSPYSTRLNDLLQQAAGKLGIHLMSGCYAAVTGPNYETPAEIRALAKCGADAVGMSTVREVEAACELGLECAAISCITNRAAGLVQDATITHREVIDTAAASGSSLARLIGEFVEMCD